MTCVRLRSSLLCAMFVYLVTPILCTGTLAADRSQVPPDDHSVAIAEEGVSEPLGQPIEIDGRPILYIYTSTAGISPEKRAVTIEHKILDTAHNGSLPVELIRALPGSSSPAFRVGDFVKIGDTLGEVVEKTPLVTRIQTQKNEIVTIPNSSVLGGIVVNYTAEARKQGVIFYTRVSIGYGAPWTTVHELLISAALATTDVLKSPAPFVLQSSLDDFYISYELNAFTSRPQNMRYIYSELHQNIQDKFNERGVEIMSPHYAALRDGNRTSIPEGYVHSDQKEPAFAFREVSRSDPPQ